MKPYHYLFLIITCFGTVVLTAQPNPDIINLGGEDVAVGPLKAPAISQIAEPAAWLTALLRGDSLRLTPGGMFVDVFFAEVKSNPGPIDAYERMNLFVFLTDELAFQDYFMNQVYANTSRFGTGATRSSTFSSSRERTAADLSPKTKAKEEADRRSAAAAEAARAKEQRSSGFSTNTSPTNEDKAALATYPLVRQYAAGSRGLVLNPKYLAKPSTSGTLDADYVAAYNKYTNLLELYSLALNDPSAGEIVKHPSTPPTYFFSLQQKWFSGEWQRCYDKLELAVNAQMSAEYVAMYNGTRAPSQRTQRDVDAITAKLSRTPITNEQREILLATMKVTLTNYRALDLARNNLTAAYQKYFRLLNEQEKIWFKWLLVNSTEMQKNTLTVLEYLKQLIDLPLSSTSYAQLVTATNLLRDARHRITNLPDAAKAQQVLNLITAHYFQRVEASAAAFQQKEMSERR